MGTFFSQFFGFLIFAPVTAAAFGFAVWVVPAIFFREQIARLRLRFFHFFVTGYVFMAILTVYLLVIGSRKNGERHHQAGPFVGMLASLALAWWINRLLRTRLARSKPGPAGGPGGPAGWPPGYPPPQQPGYGHPGYRPSPYGQPPGGQPPYGHQPYGQQPGGYPPHPGYPGYAPQAQPSPPTGAPGSDGPPNQPRTPGVPWVVPPPTDPPTPTTPTD